MDPAQFVISGCIPYFLTEHASHVTIVTQSLRPPELARWKKSPEKFVKPPVKNRTNEHVNGPFQREQIVSM